VKRRRSRMPFNESARKFPSEIPRFIPRTKPTTRNRANVSGRLFFLFRTFPRRIVGFDGPYPSFNPKAPGSRPSLPLNPSPRVYQCFRLGQASSILFKYRWRGEKLPAPNPFT
jgi:hypothetical protein